MVTDFAALLYATELRRIAARPLPLLLFLFAPLTSPHATGIVEKLPK
jgi:hypothetical protein